MTRYFPFAFCGGHMYMGYKYQYDGPVMTFGTYRGTFKGETFAPNEKRAKANIAYQAKIAMNIAPSAKIDLPGELKILY